MFRPVLIVPVTATVLGAALWGVAAAETQDPGGGMMLDRAGAVTVSVIAAMCWGMLALAHWLVRRDDRQRREYRRREAAVIRSAAKGGVATTKPLPLLREVGR